MSAEPRTIDFEVQLRRRHERVLAAKHERDRARQYEVWVSMCRASSTTNGNYLIFATSANPQMVNKG